mgnify:FL=1
MGPGSGQRERFPEGAKSGTSVFCHSQSQTPVHSRGQCLHPRGPPAAHREGESCRASTLAQRVWGGEQCLHQYFCCQNRQAVPEEEAEAEVPEAAKVEPRKPDGTVEGEEVWERKEERRRQESNERLQPHAFRVAAPQPQQRCPGLHAPGGWGGFTCCTCSLPRGEGGRGRQGALGKSLSSQQQRRRCCSSGRGVTITIVVQCAPNHTCCKCQLHPYSLAVGGGGVWPGSLRICSASLL